MVAGGDDLGWAKESISASHFYLIDNDLICERVPIDVAGGKTRKAELSNWRGYNRVEKLFFVCNARTTKIKTKTMMIEICYRFDMQIRNTRQT